METRYFKSTTNAQLGERFKAGDKFHKLSKPELIDQINSFFTKNLPAQLKDLDNLFNNIWIEVSSCIYVSIFSRFYFLGTITNQLIRYKITSAVVEYMNFDDTSLYHN